VSTSVIDEPIYDWTFRDAVNLRKVDMIKRLKLKQTTAKLHVTISLPNLQCTSADVIGLAI
jgi:hypothetical protein